MIAWLMSVFAFASGWAFAYRCQRWKLEWEYDRGFAEGRRSERGDALREQASNDAPFVMLTSGDGSRETPFTREMHHAQCGAFHGRACDCDLVISRGSKGRKLWQKECEVCNGVGYFEGRDQNGAVLSRVYCAACRQKGGPRTKALEPKGAKP